MSRGPGFFAFVRPRTGGKEARHKMKYKIGDVAHILGISTDLLRYYEKKGVVTPEKNENNDYRYYDSWDINFLTDCLWFKNFGFSIEQIADIVRIPGIGELSHMLEDKEDELRETIARSQLLLRRSAEHRKDLEKIGSLLYQCEISDSPELIRFINRVGDDYIRSPLQQEAARRWLRAMPFNQRYFEMAKESPLPGSEEDYCWGYSLSMDYAAELGFEAAPPMGKVPSRRSIHTVFKNSGGQGSFSPSLLQYALDYAESVGLPVFGPIHGVLLASVMEEGQLTGYFEAWLPVE